MVATSVKSYAESPKHVAKFSAYVSASIMKISDHRSILVHPDSDEAEFICGLKISIMEADTIVEIFATCSGDLAYDLTEVATNLGFWVASYRTSKLDFVQVKSASSFPKTGNLSLQQAYKADKLL